MLPFCVYEIEETLEAEEEDDNVTLSAKSDKNSKHECC